MKHSRSIRPTATPCVSLLEVVAAVRACSRSDAEAARVVNHLLATRRIRFLAPVERFRRLLH